MEPSDIDTKALLDTFGVKDRRSKDYALDNAGRRLISICEGAGVLFLHGRSGREK